MTLAVATSAHLPQVRDWMLSLVEELGGKPLRIYQRRLLGQVVDSVLLNEGRSFTVEWARQIGKTEGGQMLILAFMIVLPQLAADARYRSEFPILTEYRDGFLVGFVAPKIETARIPFKRLRRLMQTARVASCLFAYDLRVVSASSQELSLSNGSTATALSGSPTAFQEGHTLHLLWLEETQKLQQYQVRKQFEPMLAATNGTSIKVGTAGTIQGVFLEDIDSNRRLNPSDHSEINWRQAIEMVRADAPGDPWPDRYEKWVMNQIAKHPAGELAQTFRMNFMLEWFLKAYRLLTSEQWAKMRADGQNGRPRFGRGEFSPDAQRRAFGLDLAKTQDSTVCAGGDVFPDHVRVVDWLQLDGTDYVDQVDALAPWMIARGYDDLRFDARLTIDSTGVGDPVTDMMRRRLRGVTGYTYTLQSKDALYKLFTARLPKLSGACGLFYADCRPDDREWRLFELQMLNCVVETKGNCVAYHHPTKDETDEDEDLLHDDHVDGTFNLLHAAEQPRGNFQALRLGPTAPAEPKLTAKVLTTGDDVAMAGAAHRNQMREAMRR